MATYSESENRMKRAARLLGASFTVDRCRHKSVKHTALWIYRGGVQVGSISRTEESGEWKANRMLGGMPTSERRFAELADACAHIAEARWP